MEPRRSSRWEDACAAAAIFAVDPVGVGGVSLRSAPGPVRDRWLVCFQRLLPGRARLHRIPLQVADGRLLGGLDIAATLKAGRPVAERGILAAANGGIVVLAMAERLEPAAAGKIASVLDRQEIILERDGFAARARTRFGTLVLDEGIQQDERPPSCLLDRLALHLELDGILCSAITGTDCSARWANDPARETIMARKRLSSVRCTDEVLVALCETAAALGIDSTRVPYLALRVARAAAALAGRIDVAEADASLAARLVFSPRATKAPADRQDAPAEHQPAPAEQQHQAAPTGQQDQAARAEQQPVDGARDSQPRQSSATPEGGSGPQSAFDESAHTAVEELVESLQDRVMAAACAAMPRDLLARLQHASRAALQSRQSGRKGSEQTSRLRGRPAGVSAGDPRSGARMSIIETLRAAAPWQRIRRAALAQADRIETAGNAPVGRIPKASTAKRTAAARGASHVRIQIRQDDFRVMRFKRRNQTTTIFLVDASGSSALHRLAEVKGAVELMLAESYVRRDRVALIAFRGAAAQLLLPPTASLTRAKRELASLPGGGGTPLALGLDAARTLADSLQRRGESPVVVILTDGRPNVARDGKGSRVRAEADTVSAARMMRSNAIRSLLVDTAPQPRLLTETFAREMGATYLPLPYADAGTLATVVNQSHTARRTAQRERLPCVG